MENPWLKIDLNQKKIVLDEDLPEINRYNQKYSKESDLIDLDFYPEPFIGNIEAPLIFLNRNPGITSIKNIHIKDLDSIKKDKEIESTLDFKSIITKSLAHQLTDYPFYFANPKLKNHSGYEWWESKIKQLAIILDPNQENLFESIKLVSNNILNLELFPYHSINFPKNINLENIPSAKYTFKLLKQRMDKNATIISFKDPKYWLNEETGIPELALYENFYILAETQNVCINDSKLRKLPNNNQVLQNLLRTF